jgi:hypothetical protein
LTNHGLHFLFVASDLEKKIQDFIRNKGDKAKEVAMLLEMVEALQKEIAARVDGYINCTS